MRYLNSVSESEIREAICSQVAKQLKELRQKRGLSMTELAAKAGLSRAMISFIESEFRNPTIDTLLRVCGVLKIELADILKKSSKAVFKRSHR